jgi:hypothetical protein
MSDLRDFTLRMYADRQECITRTLKSQHVGVRLLRASLTRRFGADSDARASAHAMLSLSTGLTLAEVALAFDGK